MRKKILLLLNSLFPIVLAGVILSAYYIQFFKHEDPCPLCMLQRLAMIGVAIGPLLNLRFGISTAHYGISLISAVFGKAVALRQICLHICPDFPAFGIPIFGFSLYTWSFIVFGCSIFTIAIMLILHRPSVDFLEKRKVGLLGILAFTLIFIVAFADIITTLQQCGLSACRS